MKNNWVKEERKEILGRKRRQGRYIYVASGPEKDDMEFYCSSSCENIL